MLTEILPLHMGALHAYEQWLVVAIAFGPFLLLGVVIAIRRRQDLAEEEREQMSEEAVAGRVDPDARPPD
ncbi:hypothetical protein [Nocardioides alcanivorans]|uniref:hypothetical protein n=1 Tax=Nocardioides alcanivorans TaxID=2897352 RepID=UPI001F3E0F17|nr:hypothetical protein [Nocardioides alcanivorans]